MAGYYKSAGVYINEQDLSVYSRGNVEVGAAIVGPTVKGAALFPTVVTNYDEYLTLFGSTFQSGSDYYEYLTSISAREYFNNGGKSLLVVRVMSGSYANARSTVTTPTGSNAFTLEVLSDGAIMNNSGSEIANSSGSLVSGSVNNIRWEVGNVNTKTGTFSLLLRRGDDNSRRKIVLETWNNLSLDPNSSDYISARIGDADYQYVSSDSMLQITGSYVNKSAYVRVASVTSKTPNYLDNYGTAKNEYTSSLPASGSGSFTGGSDGTVSHPMNFFQNISSTNSQGFTPNTSAYDAALSLISNKDEYQFDLLLITGITSTTHPLVVEKALAVVEARQDCLLIIDPTRYGDSPTDATGQATGFNSNYAAMYYGWVQLKNSNLNSAVWCPPSTVIGGMIAYSDSVSEAWFAPAGFNRGGLPNVIQVERKLSQTVRDTLQENNVNPIATFPNNGVVVWGQKTLQRQATSTDRINVRRLLIKAKRFVTGVANNLVFEQNTNATRNLFLSRVNPFFEGVQQKQGLYGFQVIMDETNNSPDTIDRGVLYGQIYIKPTRTAEFILVDFTITPSGAVFGNV